MPHTQHFTRISTRISVVRLISCQFATYQVAICMLLHHANGPITKVKGKDSKIGPPKCLLHYLGAMRTLSCDILDVYTTVCQIVPCPSTPPSTSVGIRYTWTTIVIERNLWGIQNIHVHQRGRVFPDAISNTPRRAEDCQLKVWFGWLRAGQSCIHAGGYARPFTTTVPGT
jgi:hypothetical protein